jgi:hypothetical protein
MAILNGRGNTERQLDPLSWAETGSAERISRRSNHVAARVDAIIRISTAVAGAPVMKSEHELYSIVQVGRAASLSRSMHR